MYIGTPVGRKEYFGNHSFLAAELTTVREANEAFTINAGLEDLIFVFLLLLLCMNFETTE